MPIFLDTRGRTSLGIAVCARCGIKMPRDELRRDPNYPGLMVCADDCDDLDPYRLPARETDDITMEWTRPDFSLSPGPMFVPINPLPPFTGLLNEGNVLAFADPFDPRFPTDPTGLPPGTVWNNGGAAAVIPGITPNLTQPPIQFGFLTAEQLLVMGGGNFQLTPPLDGSHIIWNNDGLLVIAMPYTGLGNDGGVVTLLDPIGYPLSYIGLPLGALWNNGGVIGIIDGSIPNPAAAPVFFGEITAFKLLILGGGNLPTTPQLDGSGQLYNNYGEVSVS